MVARVDSYTTVCWYLWAYSQRLQHMRLGGELERPCPHRGC